MYAQKPFHAYDFCNIIIETKPTPQRKYLRFDKPKWQNQEKWGGKNNLHNSKINSNFAKIFT